MVIEGFKNDRRKTKLTALGMTGMLGFTGLFYGSLTSEDTISTKTRLAAANEYV